MGFIDPETGINDQDENIAAEPFETGLTAQPIALCGRAQETMLDLPRWVVPPRPASCYLFADENALRVGLKYWNVLNRGNSPVPDLGVCNGE
jgi:hypothetical protein